MKVYIERPGNISSLMTRLINDAGIRTVAAKKVFVKPNMLKPSSPERCLITDPSLISVVVEFLKRSGAEVVVGDNSIPTSTGNETTIAEQCGFAEASLGCFKNIGQDVRQVKAGPEPIDIYVSKDVLECDIMISIPKFKVHDLTGLTAAVKNQFGIIPGGLKPYLHSRYPAIDDFARLLVSIYQIRPPDIVLVDCMNCVDARGRRYHPDRIIAGCNGHEIDYVCARIAGVKPSSIPTVKIALEQGELDPAAIEIVGDLPVLKSYHLPLAYQYRKAAVEFFARMLYRLWLNRRPWINTGHCNKCLSCEQVCPAKAIKELKIDLIHCINCYCCIEVCPNNAITKRFRVGSLFHSFFTK